MADWKNDLFQDPGLIYNLRMDIVKTIPMALGNHVGLSMEIVLDKGFSLILKDMKMNRIHFICDFYFFGYRD